MVQTQAHFSTDARFGAPRAQPMTAVSGRSAFMLFALRAVGVVLAYQVLELLEVDRLLIDEHLGEVVEEGAVRRQHSLHTLYASATISFTSMSMRRSVSGDAPCRPAPPLPSGDSHDVAPSLSFVPPLRHHPPRDVAHLLPVVRRARRHLVLAVHELLGDAAAERGGELALEVPLQ